MWIALRTALLLLLVWASSGCEENPEPAQPTYTEIMNQAHERIDAQDHLAALYWAWSAVDVAKPGDEQARVERLVRELELCTDSPITCLLDLTDEEFATFARDGRIPESIAFDDDQLGAYFHRELLEALDRAKGLREQRRQGEEEARQQALFEQQQEEWRQYRRERDERRRKEKAREEHNMAGALVAAQGFVKRNLKSPGTASFGRWYEQTIDEIVKRLGENRYRVKGWVDAQNAFGAVVRIDFVAVVRHDSNRDRWILESLDIDER